MILRSCESIALSCTQRAGIHLWHISNRLLQQTLESFHLKYWLFLKTQRIGTPIPSSESLSFSPNLYINHRKKD